jgi:1,4-dihydroxy-2-naphthoate octaprenyltransferase
VLIEGLLPAHQVFWAGLLCLASGVILGLLMGVQRGTPVLLLGLIGLLASLVYIGWPVRLSDWVTDEAAVFIGLGPVTMLGSWSVLTGGYAHPPALLSPSFGMLAAAILVAARLHMARDPGQAKPSSGVPLGWEGARRLYYVLTGGPYLLVFGGLVAGMLPGWAWLTFCSAPLTGYRVVSVWRATSEQRETLAGLDRQTAHAYLAFGLSLGLGLLLAGLS